MEGKADPIAEAKSELLHAYRFLRHNEPLRLAASCAQQAKLWILKAAEGSADEAEVRSYFDNPNAAPCGCHCDEIPGNMTICPVCKDAE